MEGVGCNWGRAAVDLVTDKIWPFQHDKRLMLGETQEKRSKALSAQTIYR